MTSAMKKKMVLQGATKRRSDLQSELMLAGMPFIHWQETVIHSQVSTFGKHFTVSQSISGWSMSQSQRMPVVKEPSSYWRALRPRGHQHGRCHPTLPMSLLDGVSLMVFQLPEPSNMHVCVWIYNSLIVCLLCLPPLTQMWTPRGQRFVLV